MRKIAIAAAAAALLLGGCDMLGMGKAGGNESAGNAAGNQSGSKDPVRTADAGVTSSRSLTGVTGGKDPAAGGAPAASFDPALLVGSWSDNGDCDYAVEIFADGSFRHFNGGQGTWILNGDTVTFAGGSGSMSMRLQTLDSQTMVATNLQNGQLGRSVRC